MPEVIEKEVTDVVEKKDIKEFIPTKRKRFDDVISEKPVVEEKVIEEVVETKPVEEPVRSDDDFKLPETDDPFDMGEKMVDVQPEDKKVDKPVDTSVADKKEANKGLRDELKATRDRLSSQTEAHEKAISDMSAKLNESNQRLAYRNPDEHPDVIAITKPWDNELKSFAKEMTLVGGDGERLKALAPELVRNFNDLDENSADYDDRKEKLIGVIEENFPDDKREVIRLFSRGADAFLAANEKIAEIKKGGQNFEVGQANENYDAVIAQYDKLEKGYFNPSKELRETDPLNQKVLLRDLIDSSDLIREKSEKVKAFTRFALTPLALPKESDLRGMDEDASAQFLQKRTAEHNAAKKRMGDMIGEALMSHTMFPVLSRDLAAALKQIEDYKRALPSPNGNDDDQVIIADSGEETDIKDFKPKRSALKF